MAEPLRVLVVARQPIERAGLRGLLADRPEVLVVGQALSFADAEQRLAGLAPDLVLARWEPGDAAEVADFAATLGEAGAGLLLLGEAPSTAELAALLRAGLRGFLLPEATAEDLAAALHAVRQGLLVLDPALSRALASAPALALSDDLGAEEPLTERELEVLQQLALGLPNKAIARKLGISEHTVKFHVGSILTKLGAASRTEAVTRAVRRGLLAL